MVKSLTAPSVVTLSGKDPDGMIDNRPGVAHPERPGAMGKEHTGRMNGDDFARHRVFGNDVVNQTRNSRGAQKNRPDVPVGTGVGSRNPKKSERSKDKKVLKKQLYRVFFDYEEDDEETVAD